MRFFNKSVLSKIKYIFQNGKSKLRIVDYGCTFLKISKSSIGGEGSLYINKNAVSKKEHSKIGIDKGGHLIIKGNVYFYPNCNIHILHNALLEIGDGTYFNEGTKIAIKNKCKIGERCAISNDVTIMDSDFHNIETNIKSEKGIEIGNHVWIGANSTILKNVIVEDGAIVGANSVVTKSVSSNCIVAGNPAKTIKTGVIWK